MQSWSQNQQLAKQKPGHPPCRCRHQYPSAVPAAAASTPSGFGRSLALCRHANIYAPRSLLIGSYIADLPTKNLLHQLRSLHCLLAMAKAKAAPALVREAEGSGGRKTVVLVAVDDSDHSNRALEWAVRHVATAGVAAAELVVVHAKPPASSVVTFGSPAAAGDVVRMVDADLRKRAEDVVDRARGLCVANSVHGLIEVMEGEARYVLCDAVDKHRADLLVVGSHGYGAIKRAFLGSVSDYCAHHAHCSVMIVKQPKSKK